MSERDLNNGSIISPADKAKKQLNKRISRQQTKRFYRTAHNLNSSESNNLETRLKSISTTQLEYKRLSSANERIFKLNRRRNILSAHHVQVEDEICNLNNQRRKSMALSKLNITQNISSTKGSPLSVVGSPLPKTSTAALHDGVPTMLSRPSITRRIKTAPAHGRTDSTMLLKPTDVELNDPLRLLERIETSDGFCEMRNRVASGKRSAHALQSSKRTTRDVPSYLALDPLEKDVFRSNKKRQAIDQLKRVHAGSDDRCSELVRQWIQK